VLRQPHCCADRDSIVPLALPSLDSAHECDNPRSLLHRAGAFAKHKTTNDSYAHPSLQSLRLPCISLHRQTWCCAFTKNNPVIAAFQLEQLPLPLLESSLSNSFGSGQRAAFLDCTYPTSQFLCNSFVLSANSCWSSKPLSTLSTRSTNCQRGSQHHQLHRI
jgi:hypothetical protein